MKVPCPFCRTDVPVQGGRLADHPAMKGKTASCLGSGAPVAEIRALNEEHRQTRERTDRITGRRR